MDSANIRAIRTRLGLSQARLAELTGINQHILSSYELGKTEVAPKHLDVVQTILSRPEEVAKVVGRKKRYQQHSYTQDGTRTDRSMLASRSNGNSEFLATIAKISKLHLAKEKVARGISLFSGIGGLSLGFSAAGVKIKGFLEKDEDLRQIYRLNFPDAWEMGGDILSITDSQIQDYANKIGEVEFVVGGPPCQGFSLSGKRDKNDPRNALFRDYIRFVRVFRPKFAIIENVRVLTSMKNEDNRLVIDDIYIALNEEGYTVKHFEIDAALYGVPQHRERVIIIATRSDLNIPISLPEPEFGVVGDLFHETRKQRTFADACSDLPFLESGQASTSDSMHEAVSHPNHVIEWLWNVPQGRSAHDNEDSSLRPPSGYNTTYKRQVWNEPGSTVQTTFGMISGCRNVHPIATRSLTIREAARLQTFPDDFKLTGTNGTIRTGIGNAVPPLLAYRIAEHLLTVSTKCG